MAIRYDKNFNAEITRIVKNFNSKVMRLKGIERVLAPKTVLVSELKSEYDNRNELKRRLRELQIFSERGIEEEIVIGGRSTTKYEVRLDTRRAARAKANLTREIKKAESSPYTRNTAYVNNLRKRRKFLDQPIELLNDKRFKLRQSIISRESNFQKKKDLFYKNIFQMIYKTAYTAGMNPNDVEKALRVFRSLSPAQLADASDTLKEMNAFSLKYKLLDRVGESGIAMVASSLNNLVDALDGIKQFYK